METTKTASKVEFLISISNIEYKFICRRSNSTNAQLKNFASRSSDPYWFKGLSRGHWLDGGFWPYDYGFINSSVQGVVYLGEVYLLRAIVLNNKGEQ